MTQRPLAVHYAGTGRDPKTGEFASIYQVLDVTSPVNQQKLGEVYAQSRFEAADKAQARFGKDSRPIIRVLRKASSALRLAAEAADIAIEAQINYEQALAGESQLSPSTAKGAALDSLANLLAALELVGAVELGAAQ